MNSAKRRQFFEHIFDALFCYGEEPRCWFSPALMATSIGCSKYDIEDAVAWLQAQGRIGARYDAAGDCYARVVRPVPLSTPGRRELAAEARVAAANQTPAAQAGRPSLVHDGAARLGTQPRRQTSGGD